MTMLRRVLAFLTNGKVFTYLAVKSIVSWRDAVEALIAHPPIVFELWCFGGLFDPLQVHFVRHLIISHISLLDVVAIGHLVIFFGEELIHLLIMFIGVEITSDVGLCDVKICSGLVVNSI